MYMKRYIALLIMLVFGIGVCVTLYVQEEEPTKVRLQWKWEKGKNYRYKMTREMKLKMSGTPQGDVETSMKRIVILLQKVTEVDEQGIATIEFKCESIEVEMDDSLLGKTSFDSTKEGDIKKAEGNPHLAISAGVAGKSIIIKISRAGKIIEIKGFSKPDAFSGKSDELMRTLMQQSYNQLPKEEIALGDSWETPVEMPISSLVIIKAKDKNTYTGNETVGKRECVRIDTQRDVNILENPKGLLNEMLNMEWEPAVGASVLYFDLKEGITIKGEGKMKLKGTFINKVGEEKVEMKMEQEITVKMELME